MDNTVNNNNLQAIPGTAIGAASAQDNNIKIQSWEKEHDITKVGQKAYAAITNTLESFTDEHRSPKFMYSSDASYYGSGALSLVGRLGKLVFCKSVNDANRAAFKIDQSDSNLYSSASTTTLGTTNIETIDGWMINPLGQIIPSTNFSPTRSWIKKLFPTLSSGNFLLFAMLEIVQFTLLEALFGESEDYRITKDRKDLGAIIVDNQEIENRLFNLSKGA